MTRSFKVAGQIFNLSLPDDSQLWRYLGQYKPFVLAELCDEPLFELSLVEDLPEPEDLTVAYRSPEDSEEPMVNLYTTPQGGWYFEMSPVCTEPACAWMYAEPGLGKAKVKLNESRDRVFGINNSLMLLFAFSTSCLGLLEMHASVIKYDGKGYLFLGKSGTGKSTHSRQWLSAIEGSSLLNDDNPIVGVDSEGKVTVYGSPWSGKTRCYINDSCPVGAFVRIRQCPENKIERMSLLESYAAIYSSSSGYKTDLQMSDGLHSTMEKVVTTVPCYVLDCLPNEDSARLCKKTVTDEQ